MARDPTARFKADDAQALAAAEVLLPEEHLSQRVLKLLEAVDLSEVEAQYSALGQRGYGPRRLLSVWVYASLMGVHHATKLERMLVTDVALRVLAGGHAISRPVLNRFRMTQAELFRRVLEQTVKWAQEQGLVDVQGLAVDSVRLRAHASVRHVRIRKQSQQRLEQLKEMEQIEKERDAAEACGYGYKIGVSTQAHKDALLERDRSLNIVVTGCKR